MKYIQHRVNKISDLKLMNPLYGAEIDLRTDVSTPSSIHLSHDPWAKGDLLKDWLDTYKKNNINGTIIFNTKEDNLEEEVLSLCKSYQINNFFFLDTALPTFIRFSKTELSQHFSCRLSKYEGFDFIKQFKGKVSWVWADCFDGTPLNNEILAEVSKDFKICLVSPELQKQPFEYIAKFKNQIPYLTSICTKKPELWG